MQTATSNDGTRIAYDRYGSGPAVILVGGALSLTDFLSEETEPVPGHCLKGAEGAPISHEARGHLPRSVPGDSASARPRGKRPRQGPRDAAKSGRPDSNW